jgi:MFS family permease
MFALAGLLLAVFLDLFGLGVIRPILPIYVQEVFRVDVLRVSWIPAAFGIGKLLADMPAGVLMDRVGRNRLMAGGLALVATFDLLSALEPTFARFLLWRALAGLGFGFFVTTAATVVLDTTPSPARGRMMGSYLLVGDVGSVLGAGAGGWIYEQFGARVPFLVKAACAATAAMVARGINPGRTVQARGERAKMAPVTAVPGLLSISLVNMVLFMADVGILTVLFPLFLHAGGFPPRTIGLLVALVVLVQLAALTVGSRLADRWGRVWGLLSGLLLYALGMALLSLARSSSQTVSAALLMGLGSGTARAVPAALVGDLAVPEVRGAAMGIFRTFTDIGMILGPGILGAMATRAGYPFAFALTAGLLLVNVGLLVVTHGQFRYTRPAPGA